MIIRSQQVCPMVVLGGLADFFQRLVRCLQIAMSQQVCPSARPENQFHPRFLCLCLCLGLFCALATCFLCLCFLSPCFTCLCFCHCLLLVLLLPPDTLALPTAVRQAKVSKNVPRKLLFWDLLPSAWIGPAVGAHRLR